MHLQTLEKNGGHNFSFAAKKDAFHIPNTLKTSVALH